MDCIGVTVAEFLRRIGVALADLRWLLLPQRSAGFVGRVADHLAFPHARVIFAADGEQDYFTSSLAHTFSQVHATLSGGDRLLIVEAAAGIQVTCALYEA